MAPPGTAATTAAVAALAAEYGDVEEGRPGAGGAVAAPVKSRRGFSRWASGVSDGLCVQALGRDGRPKPFRTCARWTGEPARLSN